MSGYIIVNEELNKLYLNSDMKSIIDFIIDKYKQILLLLLVFIIIYVVDYLTYYNNLFYAMAPNVPGVTQKPPDQIKSNTFKKNRRKIKR